MVISHKLSSDSSGFTLAELLIALAILGVIATFTIPKILAGQATSRNNAIAKEVMATYSAAYQQLQLNTSGSIPDSTHSGALTPYMNYVATDTTSSVDGFPTSGTTIACGPPASICLRMHNGAILWMPITVNFGNNGYIYVFADPDGRVTNNDDSIMIILYRNGQVVTGGDYFNNSAINPSWFSY